MNARLAETLGGLALAFDLTNGFPPGKVVRTAVVSVELARVMGVSHSEQRAAFWLTVLRYLGCTSFAHEQAHVFGDSGDDQAMRFALALPEVPEAPAPPSPGAHSRAVAGFLAAPWARAAQAAAQCDAAQHLARSLALDASLVDGLVDVGERFDGLGARGRRAEALRMSVRILHVAEVAELAAARTGRGSVEPALRARAGTWLDPRVVDRFIEQKSALLAVIDTADIWPRFLASEPEPHLLVEDRRVVARVLAQFSDLKSVWSLGHSTHVESLASAAGASLGLERTELDVLSNAALLHDLGRVAVPNAVWDHPGPLGVDAWESVRLHAYATDRVLARGGAWTDVARLASSAHERLPGNGYSRGLFARELPGAARVLAVADVMAALLEDRPHRPKRTVSQAAEVISQEVTAGAFEARAADAVIAAAGLQRRTEGARPRGLTEREVEVLRLLTRGKTNKELGLILGISPRTVQNHLASAYDKLGVSTRAGAALFMVENGLVSLAD